MHPEDQLPLDIPEVAEDAIHVTKELGYRYLWIDRYCIPRDEKKRHVHIQNMDVIKVVPHSPSLQQLGTACAVACQESAVDRELRSRERRGGMCFCVLSRPA
jgi:hypothetical protein